MTIDNLTTPAAIQAVIDNPNWVIRNLQITQSYHELNLAVDRYLADANVSWCAFATWASKQAGRFIRNEEVPPKLRRFLQLDASDTQPWYTKLTLYRLLRSKPVLRYLHCTVADVGFPLGEGNHLVYAKLAPLFARFLVLIREPQPPHPEQFNIYDAGESYTEHEHRVWLRAAGFVEIECADFFLAGGGAASHNGSQAGIAKDKSGGDTGPIDAIRLYLTPSGNSAQLRQGGEIPQYLRRGTLPRPL